MKEGGLLPLGGTEETGGYKGFGLCMMVEVLCGILADGKYGSNVRRWGFHGENDDEANLGQCFMAIDPRYISIDFKKTYILKTQSSIMRATFDYQTR